MGFVKDSAQGTAKSGRAWMLPSGWHNCQLAQVDVGKSKISPDLPVYDLHFQPVDVAGAPSPIDIPRVKYSLDMNDPTQKQIFSQICGKAAYNEDSQIVWSGGEISWNGQTGVDTRAGGTVDVLVTSTEGRAKQTGGGYWEHSYRVDDVGPAGEGKKMADDAARKMAASFGGVPPKSAATQSKGKGK